MGHADKLVRQCSSQAHWIADQAHEDGEAAHREGVGREISPGSQGQGQREKCETAPAASLRLGRPAGIRLANRSNLCYMNASCNIMNWMWHSEGTTDALGTLEPAMQGLQRQGTHHLLRSLPWRCALQGWSNIHSQQDAAEFISHLLGYSQPAAYSGSWEARTTYEDPNRHASIVDTGQLLSPLILEISGPTLQHCVFHWHIQNHLHALRRSPRLLFLQIKRFRRTEAGDDTVKDTTALHIKAAEVVRIPCFVNDVDASTVIEH